MMTSPNGSIFRVTGLLWGEFAGHRWIPRTKASDAEFWCFIWSTPEQTVEQNNGDAGDLRRHRANYDIVMIDITQRIYKSVLEDDKNMFILHSWYYGCFSDLAIQGTRASCSSLSIGLIPLEYSDVSIRKNCRDDKTRIELSDSRWYPGVHCQPSTRRWRACACWKIQMESDRKDTHAHAHHIGSQLPLVSWTLSGLFSCVW